MKTKICSKCNELKVQSEYYKNGKPKKGLRPECKKCTIKYRTLKRKEELDGYWYVYKITEDNYVGITSDLKGRKAVHKYNGKQIKAIKIIAKYKKPELAIIHEAILHLIGYKGCSLKPKGL